MPAASAAAFRLAAPARLRLLPSLSDDECRADVACLLLPPSPDSLHLPVFVDTMISNAISAGVHDTIPGDVLVLPCQYLGFSHHHVKFPGTLTSTTETFMTIMEETIERYSSHYHRVTS